MFDFYKKRKIFFAISTFIIMLGIISVLINGIDLSIQFKGGAIIKYSFIGDIDTNEVADKASSVLNRNTEVQVIEDMATEGKKLVLNLAGNSGLDSSEQQELDNILKTEFSELNLQLSESNMVEPFIGKRFLINGLIAIALSAVFIILYVRFRFKKISGLSAGVIALIALAHDVSIVFFSFILFKIPINDSFIAVTLTIIGYSINDTIVIYDRIRENKNLPKYKKVSYENLVNNSINETLSRTINTTVTTVASVGIVYIFAYLYNIESITSFALPMMVGLISGCYSTICLAGPMMIMWQKKKAV
ncbi:protein translocase subunit SecF [Sedimentibacter sp. MB31-C6]|uniref:protein translocase subunit SecF n=1 Tax=Sedimentibacter sp. MB31-C6 TaxID=3109366 RepID=UPI002DDCE1DB|nr:protein translocase subunit SecF [Sedimentibacter sp. MB36-C1]WSI02888.1 protein translocase subunit SecF [Sedimentibacter sp. MB36-C1]